MDLDSFLKDHMEARIRPLYLRKKCESCDRTEGLDLYHVTPFIEIVDKVLNELQLEYKDLDQYTSYEIQSLTLGVLAEHINNDFITFCSRCYLKRHEKDESLRRGFYFWTGDAQKRKRFETINFYEMFEAFRKENDFLEREIERRKKEEEILQI